MRFQLAAAQIKPTKGDVAANLQRIGEVFAQICGMQPQPDVLVFPETVLSGYFLQGGVRDVAMDRNRLLEMLQQCFVRNAPPDAALDVVLGWYDLHQGKVYNAVLYATLAGSESGLTPRVVHVHHKFFLPTYGVFDEERFVARGRSIRAFDTRFGRAAMLICEDVWHSVTSTIASVQGAEVLYVVSASPGRDFGGNEVGNLARWKRLLPGIADEHNLYVVYAGLIGFEGGKGFTGSSCVLDPWGRTLVQGPVLDECLLTAEIDLEEIAAARASSPLLADLESALPDVIRELSAAAHGKECS